MRGSVKQDKKTKKWFYEVTVSTDPVTGKRKRKKKRGFATEKAAQKALTALLAEIQNEEYVDPSKVPLSNYLAEFLKVRSTELEKETFKMEKGNMETHVIPELGKLALGKVTSDRLQKFINKLLEEKGLQASSVKRIFDPLRIALDRAVMRGLIRENPANAVIKPKITRAEMTVWSREDVIRFLNFAKKDRMFMLFHLAFTTGLRQGELLGLRWKDLDMEQGLLRVTQVLTRDGELKPRGKSAAATRAVTLMDETIQLLKKHKVMLASEKLAAGEKYKDFGLILPSSKGTPLLHRNTNRSFDRLVKEYNELADKMKEVNNIEVPKLEKIRFHDMRHTHATLLLLAGENPKIVAERLGHSKVSVTLDTYSHVLPNMQKDVANKLAEVLNG
ncbi:tyrosine-type recombinase/integrase [Bacillus subtilis]|uniref:Tyrosine-type recombinase/integrase n=1 Tax=Bacillus subtilis TaxID=1423 RepID=A0AC62A1T5_BACIU|nr:site-specific integrase [Bacillus inaquosorum]MCY8196523.1 site-specific integrase [Bacillus spizizenii]MCY8219293.1 site-specific integrase [Bacillus spizizenii]MCY8362017.1 site-specific integrase [Bacillus spizizenii]MCY8368314.1 site-specific integrase [Bacillus spizizenii]WNW25126.1 tyrosine-type recombinase/integrase [Bacillus inaquosorum]